MNGYMEYMDIMGGGRPASRRPRMAREDRAKLFAPFAALRGLEESSRARETRFVPRPDMAEDRQEQLDRRLRALRPGDRVTVTFFQRRVWDGPEELGEIHTVSGRYQGTRTSPGVMVLDSARITLRDVLDIGSR